MGATYNDMMLTLAAMVALLAQLLASYKAFCSVSWLAGSLILLYSVPYALVSFDASMLHDKRMTPKLVATTMLWAVATGIGCWAAFTRHYIAAVPLLAVPLVTLVYGCYTSSVCSHAGTTVEDSALINQQSPLVSMAINHDL
jgi:hypothetical protein